MHAGPAAHAPNRRREPAAIIMGSRGRPQALQLFLALLLTAVEVAMATPLLPPLQRLTTPAGVEFGLLLPPGASKPFDLLIPLAADINTTLIASDHSDPFYPAYYSNSCADLVKQGWACASLDLPSHGAQIEPGSPSGIAGWRWRFDKGQDFVANST